MSNWKDVLLEDYLVLSARYKEYQRSLEQDSELHMLKKRKDELSEEIAEASAERLQTMSEVKEKQRSIKAQLAEKWDIVALTYKCDAGKATLRTTQTLRITNRHELIGKIQTIGKLDEAIKGFDMKYLKDLKKVGLLPDEYAAFEESTNVAIEGAIDK